MVNQTELKYNVANQSVNDFQSLMRSATEFTNGGFAYSGIFLVWIITFYSLSNYPNLDSFKAASFTAWIVSGFMAVMGIIQPSFVIFMTVVVAAATAYGSQAQRI